MRVALTAPPTAEPVTLAELKDYARVENTVEDSLIETLIASARIEAENETRRAIMRATYKAEFARFEPVVEIPRPPLKAVTSVEYVDAEGAVQTLAPSAYDVDSDAEPGRLIPLTSWPRTAARPDAVRVSFEAGWDAAEVPEAVQVFVLMRALELYDNRDSMQSVEGSRLPRAHKDNLLARYKIPEVA
jgi:uncharacterized phiE125 gp8 family phage protein